MKILMVGTGYVGLVTAACFSEMGHHVTCLDIDEEKITRLKQGFLPIFEPGLSELVERNTQAGRLLFTTDYQLGVDQSDVCFLALPTPSNEDGSCNLSFLYSAVSEIANRMNSDKIIVNKSTVPIGTCHQLKAHISKILEKRNTDISFDIVSNPEFLKEGCAINDCMKPDRIILGVENAHATKIMREIYSSFTINHDRIFLMDLVSAEMTKYAANAMLALRISFMNELARLCEITGADIKQVRVGIGSDQRIGYQFLYAGAGYGWSCFPKDIRALCSIAKQHGISLSILEAVDQVNEQQKKVLPEKIHAHFASRGGTKGKTIAVWGLAFKPDTDDIREAPSLSLIKDLLNSGCFVRAYDPAAIPNVRKYFCNHPQLQFCKDEYEAAYEADAIALITEWKQFRFVDFSKILVHLRQKVFFDGRNQYPISEMKALGFEYFGIGTPSPHKNLNSILCSLQEKNHERSSVPT